ncbi:MAG: 3-ketoacyl-CoA thiolase [Deltaproteobacteria bacterium RIFOXYA12_FULL_61_11]|nr:MAG: 3-ketoacyl-CoA thiolase [Deltaproteobacteria bacterium RIFOXYA12_FULL_61_11]
MKQLRKNVYIAAGYNTVSFGSGRKEFNPKKPMRTFEEYVVEAGRSTLTALPDPSLVDEAVVGNFMAGRFLRQGNLPGFVGMLHEGLRHKPATRVEGACCSGGLALATAMKTVLSDLSDISLCLGFEIQNTVKAVYGADYLAAAGYYRGERKAGHAYFFPSKFSDRAGAYFQRYGGETARKGMARWYAQMVENARLCPKAQEHHNTLEDPEAAAMAAPNPKSFVEHLNYFDCSKVSDGASSLLFLSEEGVQKAGLHRDRCARLIGFGQAARDITRPPEDLTVLDTTAAAVQRALEMAGLSLEDLGFVEVHDCFTISAMLALEAIGLTPPGTAPQYVLDGHTRRDGKVPANATGGLIGYGHYTGGTGVRQAVDLLDQLTGNAGPCQLSLDPARPYGLMISMGGNDVTVVAMIFTRAV